MLAYLLTGTKCISIHAHEEKAFLSWMRETNNIFTGNEYHFRLGVFLSTKRYIEDFNRANKGFKLGLNHLSHLTESEYKSLLGSRPKLANKERVSLTNKAEATVDWRQKGVVNPIKNQGNCGSCWAFAAIQQVETRWAQSGNPLTRFSEQNLVDCVKDCGGCGGGTYDTAIDYVINHQDGHFNLEDDYPYQSAEGACKFTQKKAVGLTKGYINIAQNVQDVEKAVSQSVVAVSIDASLQTFHHYSSGIYYDSNCQDWFLDHAVGVVGYGAEGADEYWIVRNSWGEVWGEKGYIRMAKNKDTDCGITKAVTLTKEL